MCKILTVTGPTKSEVITEFLDIAAQQLGRSQRDGFGFSAYKDEDNHAVGRYLNPDLYRGFELKLPKFTPISQHIESGKMPDIAKFVMTHARTSTNHKLLANVHPFKVKDVFLIHNGIIHWTGPKADEPAAINGCDSEQFARWIADGGDIENAKEFWSGYGAFFYHRQGVLHLLKDDTARLYGAKRKDAKGWVFGTDADDVLAVRKIIPLEFRPIAIEEVMCQFNDDGEPINDQRWKGFGGFSRTSTEFYRSYYGDAHSHHSIGYKPRVVNYTGGKREEWPLATQSTLPMTDPQVKLNGNATTVKLLPNKSKRQRKAERRLLKVKEHLLEQDTYPCPHCSATVHVQDTVCSACGHSCLD